MVLVLLIFAVLVFVNSLEATSGVCFKIKEYLCLSVSQSL